MDRLWLLGIFLGIVVVGALFLVPPSESPPAHYFCTMDAKICPDGTTLGRVPPLCDFPKCPVSNPVPQNPPREGNSIQSFVDSFNFNKVQPIQILFEKSVEGVRVFRVDYGEPQDCPSGCFYSNAVGMEYGHKVGWLRVEVYDNSQQKPGYVRPLFDFTSDDSYVMSDSFLDFLREKDNYLYETNYKPLLARDPDVPRLTLKRIAEELPSYSAPWTSKKLLENPVVQSDSEILTILASLPVYQFDSYATSRETARQYLDKLNSS